MNPINRVGIRLIITLAAFGGLWVFYDLALKDLFR
jgi:hypothetical protein